MKQLGVIGGLGPIATAYFMELVIKMTDAQVDQDHLDMILFHRPSIPDRSRYLLDSRQESPIPAMVEAAQQLERAGADYIAIPCITAHSFFDALSSAVQIPLIHMVQECAAYLQSQNVHRVGILATDGTLHAALFQRELERRGIDAVLPSGTRQQDVMALIYHNVKANRPIEWDRFEAVSAQLREKGAEVIVLGCTELSLLKREGTLGPGYLDAMEVLALRGIELCGARLNPDCQQLITGWNKMEKDSD